MRMLEDMIETQKLIRMTERSDLIALEREHHSKCRNQTQVSNDSNLTTIDEQPTLPRDKQASLAQ